MLGILVFLPGIHDKGIVHRHTGDGVGLFKNGIGVHHEAGHMGIGAAGGERAGYREQHDLAPLEKFTGVEIFRAVFAVGLDSDGGKGIACGDSHECSLARQLKCVEGIYSLLGPISGIQETMNRSEQ